LLENEKYRKSEEKYKAKISQLSSEIESNESELRTLKEQDLYSNKLLEDAKDEIKGAW
jgi:SMC interacting uncharacterized protein involved in chromosome segregation